MSGEAVDLVVPGHLDGTHYGEGPDDTTSDARVTWDALLQSAAANGRTGYETWEYMYNILNRSEDGYRTDGQNHVHVTWVGGHK